MKTLKYDYWNYSYKNQNNKHIKKIRLGQNVQGEENSEDENALLFRFLCLTFHKKHERLECISQGLSGRRQKKKTKNPEVYYIHSGG